MIIYKTPLERQKAMIIFHIENQIQEIEEFNKRFPDSDPLEFYSTMTGAMADGLTAIVGSFGKDQVRESMIEVLDFTLDNIE